jgi:hypothetical protein
MYRFREPGAHVHQYPSARISVRLRRIRCAAAPLRHDEERLKRRARRTLASARFDFASRLDYRDLQPVRAFRSPRSGRNSGWTMRPKSAVATLVGAQASYHAVQI